ncbi:MAG: VCBS repeat-containing protein, partial [Rhodothermales bacterium]
MMNPTLLKRDSVERPWYGLLLFFLLISGCAPEELTWNEEAGYRWADLNVRSGAAGFVQLDGQQTGVFFANHLTGDQVAENRHRMHGSGVALGDVDGDGWTDIYFARLNGDNVLYKNKGGWEFEDITLEAGVGASDRFSTGAVFADIDGDEDLDLLVNALGGPNAAFLNDGAGQFEEATEMLGLSSNKGSTSMALADIEGDGDLDLYVANYKHKALRDSLPPDRIAWERVVQQNEDGYHINPAFDDHYVLRVHGTKLLRLESAEADQLLLNDGEGHFSAAQLSQLNVLDEKGQPVDMTRMKDWALSVRFQDLNGDLAPDLYVCNDFESPDYIWMNDGHGTFRAIPPLSLRKTSNATMSVAVSDVNRDGEVDLFLADMLSQSHSRRKMQKATQVSLPVEIGVVDDRPQVMQNTFFLNRGDHTFAEVANLNGLQASEWTWSSAFLDVDLDGYEDLIVTNGHAFDVQNFDAQLREQQQIKRVRNFDMYRRLILDFPALHLKNVAFKNEGGVRFTSQPDGWGLGVDTDVSHGMAMADLDNDGDLDVVVNRLNKEAGLFKNTSAASRVAVRLKGAGKNSQGIGAKIKLLNGAVPSQEKEVISGGLYLSGSDPIYSFAVGTEPGDMAIEITWRNGETSRVEAVKPNRIYEIVQERTSTPIQETSKPAEALVASEATEPIFAEVEIDYQHTEAVFDDFARQPLLPRRFSQAGPAVVWADVDRDGDDDLLVGSGKGGQTGYFRNEKGRLVRQQNSLLNQAADLDQNGIVVIPAGRGTRVLVAMSNYEAQAGVPSLIRVFDVRGNSWKIAQDLDFGASGIGPLSAADIDGDGDVDVFAGGSIQPGRYPARASSKVFVNDGAGYFRLAENMSELFTDLGMVNGSVFGDMDLDGDQDLILALDWGALRYFENDGAGKFSDQSERFGLLPLTGMWHGVDLGDFNGDGRLDIVATNWGLNGQYRQSDKPQRLYWADYDRNGTIDVLESYYEPSLQGYVPQAGLNLLMYALPYLRRQIQSFSAFSTMTMPDILGSVQDKDTFWEAAELEQKVLLNTGEGFEPVDLPILAQVSPGFGVGVGDYDQNGQEDVFIAQNFFAERLDVARSDAGRGLWLNGAGDGSFTIAEGTDTGIKVYGEQRGAALSDYNGDGTLDIAISQNGNMLKLYQNKSKAAGIRVLLSGPAANPWAIGSQVRLVYTDGTKGPVRNVSVGSGYLSQHSVQQ